MGHFEDSLEFYTEANTRLRRSPDKFGQAYSFCGRANAWRMLGDYDTALSLFQSARKLYHEIGDRVSYAYTVWGEGTAYKMLRRHEDADRNFKEAEKLFQATRDSRGKVYTLLGRGELLLLAGKPGPAEPLFRKASDTARQFGLQLEECHGDLLLKLLQKERGKLVSFAGLRRRYKRLGTTFLREPSLPLNLP